MTTSIGPNCFSYATDFQSLVWAAWRTSWGFPARSVARWCGSPRRAASRCSNCSWSSSSSACSRVMSRRNISHMSMRFRQSLTRVVINAQLECIRAIGPSGVDQVLRENRQAVAAARAAANDLFFNVLSILAVDRDWLFDSRIVLRCRVPVVRAFRPEWDRSASQSNSKPYARKTMRRRRETACTALASRARAKPAGTTTGPPCPASGAGCAISRSACWHETSAARRGGDIDLKHSLANRLGATKCLFSRRGAGTLRKKLIEQRGTVLLTVNSESSLRLSVSARGRPWPAR